MDYRILEQDGIENTGLDGAILNYIALGGQDGIVPRVLNELNAFTQYPVLMIDSGELVMHGFRIYFPESFSIRFDSTSVQQGYLIARLKKTTSQISFEFDYIYAGESLKQDNLFSKPSGVYEIKVAYYTVRNNQFLNFKYILNRVKVMDSTWQSYIDNLSSRIDSVQEDLDLLQEDSLLLDKEEKQTVQGDVKFKKGVTVEGDFKVYGNYTTTDVQSLIVKDRFIVCNDGESTLASGLVIRRQGDAFGDGIYNYYNAYGIILDPDTDTVRLGRGFVEELVENMEDYEQYTPVFTFGYVEQDEFGIVQKHEESGQAIATRSDSNDILNGNLVKWDAENKKLTDSGTSLDMFSPNRVVQEGHFLYINKSGAHGSSYWDKMSGIVIPISGEYHSADNVCQDAYAIVFDSKTKTLRLGTGQIMHSKDIYTDEGEIDFAYFEFGGYLSENEPEDEAIATRADNFTDGNTPIWQESTHMFVDSGVNLDRLLERVSNLENSLGGAEESLAQINNGGVE